MTGYLAIALTVIAWSAAPALVKTGLDHGYSPLTSTCIGAAIAVPLFYFLLSGPARARATTPSRAHRVMVLGGFLGVGGTMFSYLAFGATSVAVAVPVSNVHPLVTALIAHLTVGQERIDRRLIAGMALICAGLAFVTIGSS